MVVHNIVQKASQFNQFHCKENNSIQMCVYVGVMLQHLPT